MILNNINNCYIKIMKEKNHNKLRSIHGANISFDNIYKLHSKSKVDSSNKLSDSYHSL